MTTPKTQTEGADGGMKRKVNRLSKGDFMGRAAGSGGAGSEWKQSQGGLYGYNRVQVQFRAPCFKVKIGAEAKAFGSHRLDSRNGASSLTGSEIKPCCVTLYWFPQESPG